MIPVQISLSSNTPLYYTAENIPSEPSNTEGLPSRYGIGSRVALQYGGDGNQENAHTVYTLSSNVDSIHVRDNTL